MKKTIKVLLYTLTAMLVAIILVVGITLLWVSASRGSAAKKGMALAGSETKTITMDGFTFRDLNKNGTCDVYEDYRQTISARVDDLLAQMTLEEKAGLMFFSPIGIMKDGSIAEKPYLGNMLSFYVPGTSDMVFSRKLNHFNLGGDAGKKETAEWYNRLQKMTERTRLGIPVTIGSDPKNHFSINPLTASLIGDFSLFPEPLGLAAIGDSLLTAQFADMARQEYLAVGIRVALHPMADLATEPRWGRINHTFGEDATLSSRMTYAYIRGFQGDSLGPSSVACMTKHFSGGGPQREGIDPHFPIQKGQVYPGDNFDYHLIPFEAAIAAGTAEIMPYYGVPMDQTSENVGFAFNREIITDLLRRKYNFDGVVCTDWGVISDTKILGITFLPARAHGMEHATMEERMVKAIEAGVDQFGGEFIPEMLVKLVKQGKISESRLDESAKRILRVKFQQGLFDNPFVDVAKAEEIIGNSAFMAAGELAQRKSIVLLKNEPGEKGNVLPLPVGLKVYIRGIDPQKVAKYATLVDKPEEADIGLIRLKAPSQHLKGTGMMGNFISAGDLDFKGKQKAEILALLNRVPTIVDIYLDRPAVIPEIAAASKGLLVNFGANDDAFLDVIFGRFNPQGRLPVELPSSMESVRKQHEDVPYDSEDPLFPFGFGLRYP